MSKRRLTISIKFLIFLFLPLMVLDCSKKPDAFDSQGKAIYFSNYKGKWLFVNYWAKWCVPCLKEIPMLDTFYQTYQSQVMILGASLDHLSDSEINIFSKDLGIHYPMVSNLPLERFNIPNLDSIPATLAISPEGKFIKILYGAQTFSHLRQLIGSTP